MTGTFAVIPVTLRIILLWAYSEHDWEGPYPVRCCPK